MTSGWLPIPLIFSLIAICSPLTAEEKYLDFVQGLRERNYFDYAILYLDQLSQRPKLPDEIRQVIPYERGVTLREFAKTTRNPEKQTEMLDQATAFLEQFARDNPNHPNLGDANSGRAKILFQKAELEINQSKSPANKGSKQDFQRRGRDLIKKAREVLQTAFDQHESAFKKYPVYIDEQKDPKLYAERVNLEQSIVLEALDLAKCTYIEAQSYDIASPEFKQRLRQAADEFEKISKKYRRSTGFLHAIAWQGKCFDDLGERQKALGAYDQILNDPKLDEPKMDSQIQTLKTQTLLFKLNSLFARNDYQLIVDLSEDWLKKNGAESKSALGLGVQWEQARAFEALGDNRSQQKADQERFWRQARAAAQQIGRYPGQYKDLSLAMAQRAQTKLGGKEKAPEDFASAFAAGERACNSAVELKREIDTARRNGLTQDQIDRLKQDWTDHLNEAVRNLELAIRSIGKKDNAKDIAAARTLYSRANFFLHRNLEAAAIGQYLARTAPDDEANTALDGASLVVAAFIQNYNDNKIEPDQKTEDLQLIVRAANQLVERWPNTENANEARLRIGQLYSRSVKKPLEAAKWLEQIPESDPRYAEAQLATGRDYWSAYVQAAKRPKDDRPTPETIAELKTASETHLRTGIAKMAATLPQEGAIPPELIVAKISLAENLISQDKDAEAVGLLLNDPHSVIKAVTVEDESQRPEQGVQRRPIARSAYMTLLRGYMGMGLEKLDDARATMKKLESIVENDSASDLTGLYVDLGRMLKAELERFRNTGETDRVKKLMTAFQSFLDDVYKKQDGQTLGSLSWIGETYFALGEMATDAKKAAGFYDRAGSAFNNILTRTQTDPNFATPDQILNVKVRMVHFNRLENDFASAEKLLAEVIKARGNDLRTQVEGAAMYQDWGIKEDKQKLLLAIAGNPEIGLWGWGMIAKRIEGQPDLADRPELVEAFLDARYSVSLCRYQYAKGAGAKDKQKALDLCAMELIGSASKMKTIPDEKRAKLNELYRDVMRESGKPAIDLPRFDQFSSPSTKATEPDSKPAQSSKTSTAPNRSNAPPKPDSTQSDQSTVLIVAILFACGAGIMGWILMSGGKKKRKPMSNSRKETAAAFTGIAVESPSAASTSSTTVSKPRPKSTAPKLSTETPAAPASRPAPRTETGQVPAPKPRPKPPISE